MSQRDAKGPATKCVSVSDENPTRKTRTTRAVQRFLDGVETGAWLGMEQHFTPTAMSTTFSLATRSSQSGPGSIVQALGSAWPLGVWRIARTSVAYGDDTIVVELETHRSSDGPQGTPDIARCSVDIFVITDGRIAALRSYQCEAPARHQQQTAQLPAHTVPDQPTGGTHVNQ